MIIMIYLLYKYINLCDIKHKYILNGTVHTSYNLNATRVCTQGPRVLYTRIFNHIHAITRNVNYLRV